MRLLLGCGVLVLGLACGCSDDGPGEGEGGGAKTPATQPADGGQDYIYTVRYEGRAAVHAKSLQETLRTLGGDLRSASIEDRKKALRSILPTQADLQAIAPAHAEKLWSMMGPSVERMVERVDDMAVEYAREVWIDIDAIDIRQETWSRHHQAVAKAIPESIPAFRLELHGRKDKAGSSTYLYINDRWIHLTGIEEFARAIAALDKAKANPPKPKDE